MKLFEKFTRNRFLIGYDILFSLVAFIVTKTFMDYHITSFAKFFSHSELTNIDLIYFIASVLIYLCSLFITDNHRVMWSFAGTRNYLRLIYTLVVSILLNICVNKLIIDSTRFSFLFNAMMFVWVLGLRMAVRGGYHLIKLQTHRGSSKNITNVLIIGAGSAGTMLLRDLTTNALSSTYYNVVGFIDKDPHKIGSYIENIKVLGDKTSLVLICKECDVKEIYIAIPSMSPSEKTAIINECSKTDCVLKIMVSLENSLVNQDGHDGFVTRKVEIEDLLERDPIELDCNSIESDICDRTVLVSGGGGSIGSELCRQIIKFSPKKLIVLDIYENNAYDLQMELTEAYPDLDLVVEIASVRDVRRLSSIFKKYSPDIVFHAAAHKHVPLMEVSPGEAIKNNVFGTYNIAKCADKYGVSKFVMISTDKAVNPTNVMGATKRMCEMIIQAMSKDSKTKFVAVRFGNVLGSNGSVIPLFKRQIEHGGPVRVTHKDITRFFMTIPEAAQLVIQAAASADGGEIFVLDMGKPVRIYDLAVNLIKLSGYRPNIDIPIEIIGLRPGEKLYEELLMNEEGLTDTKHSKIFIGKPMDISLSEVEHKMQVLSAAVASGNPDEVKTAVAEVVPTYKRTDN